MRPAQKSGTGRPGRRSMRGAWLRQLRCPCTHAPRAKGWSRPIGGVATCPFFVMYACARAKRVEQAGGVGGDNRGREWPREFSDP